MNKHTKIRPYTDKQLFDRVESLPSFTHWPTGLWYIGVRSNEDTPNIMDDAMFLYDGKTFVGWYTATTNPGTEALEGGFLRYNSVGAAVLKAEEWMYDFWAYIYRPSRGHELYQRAKAWIFRDGNRNKKSEQIGKPLHMLAGLNHHTNTFKWYNKVVNWFIGPWSYGCQVTNQRAQFLEYMKMFRKRKKSGVQKYVTYVLIDEFDPGS